MSNFIFVLDSNQKPLIPCKPVLARKLLYAKKAAVFRRYPFTIILKKVIEEDIKEDLELKLDPGSRTTGIALVQENKVIWAAELTHRGNQIKASLDSRRSIRRSRRNRKTRYRKARFLNRTKSKSWLAPSLLHRVQTTMAWVKRLIKFTPVKSIAQELVKFDLQKLEKPEISGVEYQQGALAGYEVREYLLEKWQRKCSYCQISNVPLQIEHIIAKANGGTNRINNLCLACEKCNINKGTQDIRDFLSQKPDLLKQLLAQSKRPLKDAAAVNSTRVALLNQLKQIGLNVVTGSGGQTKFNRTQLKLPKTHWIDAACVGEVKSLEVKISQPLLIKCTGHGTRQMCRTDKYGFPIRYVPRFKFVKGFQTGDIVKAIVPKGKKQGSYVGRIAVRSTGSFNIATNIGLVQGINSKYCSFVHQKDGYGYSFQVATKVAVHFSSPKFI